MSAATRTKPALVRIPVTERMLVYRMRRYLRNDEGRSLRKLRSPTYADKPFVIEHDATIEQFLDVKGLEALGRKLGVLRPTEEMTP